jgi:hypothetical protein
MPGAEKAETASPAPAAESERDEFSLLRDQMAEMQKKLDALTK